MAKTTCQADILDRGRFRDCKKKATYREPDNGNILVCDWHARVSRGHGIRVVRI